MATSWSWVLSSALLAFGLVQLPPLQNPGQTAQPAQAPPQRGGAGRGVVAPPPPTVVFDPGNTVPPLVADLNFNCTADLRWVNNAAGGEPKLVDRLTAVAGLNLLSVVGKPDNCLPAEIRLNVYYYDALDNLICSGVMNSAMTQTAPSATDPGTTLNNTMTSNIEIRPYSLPEFFRWRNGPRPQALSTRRLVCVDPDGLTEVGSEFDLATLVRIYATLLPRGGGISTVELRLKLGF